MVIREAGDGSTYVSTQEEHAELSAQFAAHWGNDRFARLRPYDTMVFATTFHDSGYREWEGMPRMDVEKGRPYGHRERIPGFEDTELKAYRRNADWVRGHDLYAGLLVSMHRTGLWRGRYDVLTSPKPQNPRPERRGEGRARRARGPAATGQGRSGRRQLRLRITPNPDGSVKMDPYPFDVAPLRVAVRARQMQSGSYSSEADCREAYYKTPAALLHFDITA